MALTYLNSKMIEEPANFDQIYVISLTALSSTVQNTLTNDLTSFNMTGDSVISTDTPGNALTITQRGIGNALVVEDSNSPDPTPFVVKSDGRVGVGTTTPTTQLEVNGNIKGNTLLGTNATITNTGTIPTVVATNITTQNLSFPLNGAGSIINNATLYGNLTILGAISALSGLSVTSTFTSQASALSLVNTGSEAALYVDQGPNLSGVAVFVGSGTEVLKINNPNPNPENLPAVVVNGSLSASGNTFIGGSLNTTTPELGFGFTNVIAAESNGAIFQVQNNTGTIKGGMACDSNGTRIGNRAGNLPTIFTSGVDTERMRIDSSGNVSIGTQGNSARLNVHEVNPTRGILTVLRNDGSSGQTGSQIQISQNNIDDWSIGQPAGTSAFSIWQGRNTAADGTERMRIDSSGNVGIGTGSPGFKLDVSGAGRFTGGVQFNNGIELKTATLNYIYFDDALALARGGVGERMRIDSSGNVGIGTTNPGATLEINGSIAETKATPTITTNTLTLALNTATFFAVSLNANITTMTFSNPPANPRVYSFTLQFTADGTPRVVTWPISVKWAGGTAPTLTSTNGKIDTFTFVTHDGGTNYFGFISGQNS